MTERDARNGTILVVCTGNVCRSPYIERLLAARLDSTAMTVSSAGTGALVGSEMDQRVAQRLTDIGCDPAGFIARQLTSEMARAADIVLCATREHRSSVVRTEPSVLRRTYALADFSDLAARLASIDHAVGRPVAEPGATFGRRVSEAASCVRAEIRARTADEAEIGDPYRRPNTIMEQMIMQIDALLQPIVSVLTAPLSPTTQMQIDGSD